MNVISIISDLGADSFYLARVKASIIHRVGDVPIIDISHNVKKWEISEAAFLLRNSIDSFKDNTIFFVGVTQDSRRHIAVKFENFWFIAPDNGIVPEVIQSANFECYNIGYFQGSNFLEEFYPEIAAQIIENDFEKLNYEKSEAMQRVFELPVNYPKMLRARYIHFDSFGNALTNLTRQRFEAFVAGAKFKIMLNEMDSIEKISEDYIKSDNETLVALFNSAGFLEIACVNGNARQLFGLDKVEFLIVKKEN